MNLLLSTILGYRSIGDSNIFNPSNFPISTAMYNGDSRTASAGDYTNSGTSVTLSVGLTGVQSAGLIQPLTGNKFILPQSFQYGVGATTSRAHEERDKSTSIATTGNPANTDTSIAADAQFAIRSDGGRTPLTQAGKHIFTASVGVNDNSGTAATYYNSPSTAWQTLRTMARIADAYGAAGKVWYVGNEFPRGDTFYTMESRTVTAGSCTATNTTNFTDGETFGMPGVIGLFASGLPRYLTKVSSAPGQGQYTVTSGGVYTFGGTAPTTVWINYNASPSGGRTATYDQLRIIKEFVESTAANFVSTVNSVDYGIPGLRYNRPWVRLVDTFGALVDSTTGATQLPKKGTYDNLQLHNQGYGCYLAGKAFAAAFAADYPTAPDLSTRPTRNNWWAARGSGVGTTFSGTLPTTMRTGFTGTAAPTLLSINGSVIGAVNTSTGVITGPNITSGSLDFATGAWTVTLNSATLMPANAQLWFEQDIGNGALVFSSGVFSSWTEGTIGRNAVMNGLMDMFTATGTNLLVFNGVSSVTGIANTSVPYGYTFSSSALNTAIANGTATVAVVTGTDADGYPFWAVDLEGTHSATVDPSLSTGAMNNFGSRITAGDKVISGATWRYARHGTRNKIWGNAGGIATLSLFLSGSVLRPSSAGSTSVTSLSTRVTDQGTGIYAVDEQILRDEGGVWSPHRLSPLLDTTGATFGATNTFNLIAGRGTANVPFAFRNGYGRAQVRRRNDVT